MHGLIPFLQHFLTSTINQLIEGIFTGKSTFAFGMFAYYSNQAMQQNDLNYSNTTYAMY